MVYAVLTSLSLVCLAAGLTLLATSLGLSRRARRYHNGMQALLRLGGRGLEPLEIPPAAWQVLQAAGWGHLQLTGDWFGQPVNSEWGARSSPTRPSSKKSLPLVIRLNSGEDVILTVALTHSAVRGEGRMFADQLARVFILLLEAALRTRTEAISLALAERARLTLYLQHDMRNLAQWVGWVCADFSDCPDPESLLAAGQRLQRNAPLAQERAQKLIASLGNSPANESPSEIDLGEAIERAAHLAGVEVRLHGEAKAWIAQALLARALDNLFSNLAPNWRDPAVPKPVLQLGATTSPTSATPMAVLHFFSPWPESVAPIASEKLFEPFASGRPGGLGLGLYQARKSLREAGGDLTARCEAQGLMFLLRIPSTKPH